MFSRTLIAVAFASAVALPMAASAGAVYHPAATEAGVTEHPEHFVSTQTRAQTMAEVFAAQRDGSLARIARGLPLPAETQGMNKTRAQVMGELVNESAAERRVRLENLRGG